MTKEQKALLELVKIGSGRECLFSESVSDADWSKLYKLSQEQGVVGIAWNGIKIQYNHGVNQCPQVVKLQWYAASQQRDKAVKAKKQLCIEFVEKLAIPCVVLKGLDYCRFWPEESWREFGDLDVWSEGKYDEVNKRIDEIGGKRIDNGYYKHSEWMYKDLMVENHLFLTMCDDTRSGMYLEKTLRVLVANKQTEREGYWLSPCNEFTAIFMLVHAHQHFFYEGLSLRQILDWKFFIEREENNTNWANVLNVLKNADIKGFYDVMTEFCVKYLGLRTSLSYDSDNDVLQQFTDVIFAGEDVGGKMKRLVCRYRRMWRFRKFLGSSLLTRIKNTLVFNRLHRMPEL